MSSALSRVPPGTFAALTVMAVLLASAGGHGLHGR